MNLRQNEQQRTLNAPAKLNLFLEVLGRRGDGYHELETLMVPVGIYDSLMLAPTPADANGPGKIALKLFGPAANGVPSDATNLVVRALKLLHERSGCELGAEVELVKRIPSAAGLGGGSSDAAAALRLGNRAWGIHWPMSKLVDLADELGSDVPFFLARGAAICRGRGERIERIVGTLPLHVVIVKPPIALSTTEVYRALDQRPADERKERKAVNQPSIAAIANALRRGAIGGLGQWMSNGLQAAAAVLSPWIDRIQAIFAELDFLGHQLSGSGSAYFGVCRHGQHARRLATILRTRKLGFVYVTRSCR